MSEIIVSQLHNNLSYIAFCLAVIAVPMIIAILSMIISDPIKLSKPKSVTHKLSLVFLLLMLVTLGAASIVAPVKLSIGFIKDYSEETVLVKEGVVERRLSISKRAAIEVDNERFILSPDVERVKAGEYCKIEYFKNSKYVYDLKVID